MIAAVDIGGTKIATALIDGAGRPAGARRFGTHEVPGPEAALLRLAKQLRETCRQGGGKLAGIGVSCTGPVDPKTGVIGEVDVLPGWAGVNLAEFLEREFRVPVAVENDADAAALGEARWGCGKDAARFIYVTVSTGIGAGLIFDGRLYRGASGAHPELGHHVIDASGPRCYCGARGCWESLASGTALARWFAAQTGPENSAAIGIDAAEICRLAGQGHPMALRAVERQGHYLGVGLANLITLFCPDVVALGGGVMRSAGLFLDRAKTVVASTCGLVPWRKSVIRTAGLGPDTALIGAAQAWHHRFEATPAMPV